MIGAPQAQSGSGILGSRDVARAQEARVGELVSGSAACPVNSAIVRSLLTLPS